MNHIILPITVRDAYYRVQQRARRRQLLIKAAVLLPVFALAVWVAFWA